MRHPCLMPVKNSLVRKWDTYPQAVVNYMYMHVQVIKYHRFYNYMYHLLVLRKPGLNLF